MYLITEQQIDYILSDLKQNGIATEDLQNNLLDHVCCILEQQLVATDDFKHHYHQIISTFYNNNLQELEEETQNLLTFKNYYSMRKTMLVSGLTAAIMFAAGSFFKLMFWPGAGILLVSATIVFAFVFLPLVFAMKSKEVKTGIEKLNVGLGTLLGIMFCLDILFTVQHWPGATKLWFATIILSFFVLIPINYLSGMRKPDGKVNTILSTVMLIGFTSLMFTMLALKPKENYDALNYLQNDKTLKNLEHISGLQTVQISDGEKIWHLSESIKQTIVGNNDVNSLEDLLNLQGSYRDANGLTLIQKLKTEIDVYNQHPGHKAHPLYYQETILNLPEHKLIKTNNVSVLNAITQLQLALLINELPVAKQSIASAY